MNWFNAIIGIVGVVGVVVQMPTDLGSWLVGIAFLLLAIKGFVEK